MNRETYIQAYKDHYAQYGLVASGTGEYVRKLELWYEIGYTDDMSVLDYGCGWGAMVPGIKDRSLYYGVDIVPQAIEMARERYPDTFFDVLQIGELNLPPVDFAAAQSVFTHALREDVPACLSDIYRTLKSGGFGLIDVLHAKGNDSLLMRYYRPDEWLGLLDAAGFTGEEVAVIKWPAATHTYYKVVKP